jgi:predicted metal-dependent hydrolase
MVSATIQPEVKFLRGVQLFNAREFYECHEALEELWVVSQGSERLFLQALIHFAVGFYHSQQHNSAGAGLQLRKALSKIAGYLPRFQGVNTEMLYREGQICLEIIKRDARIEVFPKIEMEGA